MKSLTGATAVFSKLRRELLKGLSRWINLAPARASFEGLQLNIPLVQGLGADHLSRSDRPWTYHLFASLLRDRPGAFVDIGANVGLYLIWLKSVDESRRYIGFEPNPACCFYLQELIRHNSFDDVSVFPLALSDARRQSTFFARRLGDKMGSLHSDHRTESDKPFSFDVLTEPGDPVFADLDPAALSVMKIDVEGAELEVLRGLKDTLRRHRPVVLCEILVADPAQSGFSGRMQRLADLLTLTRDLEYQILSVGADKQLYVARTAEDLQNSAQPDRILVTDTEVEQTLELWRDLQQTL
jgi:FkbM family methyltransferase